VQRTLFAPAFPPDAAHHAPGARFMQPWRFIRVRSQPLRQGTAHGSDTWRSSPIAGSTRRE
jgi:hypothetical protein